MRARVWLGCVSVMVLFATGCSGRRSSLLLERHARGPIQDAPAVAKALVWVLNPEEQTLAKEGIEATVRHASLQYLVNFFSNKDIFGEFAGHNPYYPEHLVFYVKMANRSMGKIRIQPDDFVLVDDRGNQYSTISVDYVTAFAEYRQPFRTATRGVLEDARPGYFGFSLPVGKLIASKPQGRFALIKQSSLQSGYLYPGVTHDGLIAFWNPGAQAQKFTLRITNVKTVFDAKDEPQLSIEFPFTFEASKPQS